MKSPVEGDAASIELLSRLVEVEAAVAFYHAFFMLRR
jgi:hypothetical protein